MYTPDQLEELVGNVEDLIMARHLPDSYSGGYDEDTAVGNGLSKKV